MTKPCKLAYGIGLAAVVCGLSALAAPAPLSWLLAWASVSCGIAAGAYVANRPGVYGKHDGRRHRWLALPSAIFLVAFRIACALMRVWRKHPVKSQITPALWVAGRVEGHDLPDDLDFVVDLVAEFDEPRGVRERPGYRGLYVLDGGSPPDDEPVLALLDEIADPAKSVLIHCDSGMGRAPTFAVLALLRRGEADSVEEAILQIESARPFVHIGRADLAFLASVEGRVERPGSCRATSTVAAS